MSFDELLTTMHAYLTTQTSDIATYLAIANYIWIYFDKLQNLAQLL